VLFAAVLMMVSAAWAAAPADEARPAAGGEVAQAGDGLEDLDADPMGSGEGEGDDEPEPVEPARDDTPAIETINDSGSRREAPAASQGEGEGGARRDANYVLRLRELEDQLNDLKEEIFRSKSRLVLLRERVLGTRIGGAQAVLTHVNDMSATFTLERAVYILDGQQLFVADNDDGELDDREEIEIYNGAIVPGTHNVGVELELVGNGFGLFTYLEGYRVRLRSSSVFIAEDGKVVDLRIVAFEQGGINQPMEERPAVRFELELVDNVVAEE
jgi:hypothetical protein